MTTLAALGLGGERAMMLWCMVAGWTPVLLTYVLARRHLDVTWSLAAAAAVMSVPAMVYGAVSGQVEGRLAALVVVAALALAESRKSRGLGSAALAGLAVGLAVATKYPALFLGLIGGAVLLAQQRRWAKLAVFGGVSIAAGCQWYGWNWWNTGDPVFPMLFGLVPYRDGVPWDAAIALHFKTVWAASDAPVPRSLWQFLSYPFEATLAPHPAWEAGRTESARCR